MVVTISVTDSFDGGNIKYITTKPNNNDNNILDVIVRIRPDVYTELENIIHMQYFSFRVMIQGIDTNGRQVQKVKYIIENAHAVSFPDAWPGTTVCYSYDVENVDSWERNINTYYTDGQLWWEHDHTMNGCIYFSYFPPYSYARHLQLISKCATVAEQDATVTTLGQTLQGREMECITVGTGPLIAWIIHRQHPGETMAEHYAEGLLYRLLKLNNNKEDTSDDETVVDKVKSMFTFYIIPCMCPDGAVLGHLRTNSCGANLNREWSSKVHYDAPTLERSPEVYYVLEKMKQTGCDFFLDVHGDEELPYNFTNGSERIPNWDIRLQSLHGAFTAAYSRINPDMQRHIGYPSPTSTEQVLQYMNVATNQIAYRFNCLAITLEMPFKDCRSRPNPKYGWTPARSRSSGASVLDVMIYIQPYLRNDTKFWLTLPVDDAYVETTNDYENNEEEEDDPRFQLLKTRFYSDVHELRKPTTSPSSNNNNNNSLLPPHTEEH